MINQIRLQNKFPHFFAEFPAEFHIFFDEFGEMTKCGQIVNGHIKKTRRKRMQKK